MDEKKLRAVIKTCMALTILILAYFVPRIAFREQLGSETNQAPAAETGSSETALTETEQVEPKIKGQRGLIILDPGHGGMDPGMIGVGGIEEKLINLQVSLVLAEKLEEQGFETMLTRTEDRGLYDPETVNKKAQDMQRRCALIEENDPLLTVSIHQNSYSDPAVYGPQVFYFEHSAEGKELATCIQEQLNTQLGITKPREIKGNTNYYILKRSASVTVLVECAFLSNPEEAAKIQTEEYQNAVATAICDGIVCWVGLSQ